MKLIISPEAVLELYAIWLWNAKDKGVRHADAYLAFLDKRIDGLRKSHAKGRPISGHPSLRYILIKRRSGGHGHIAVYSSTDKDIVVAHVFHTSQDWQSKLFDSK